jgi:hypothetical protein
MAFAILARGVLLLECCFNSRRSFVVHGKRLLRPFAVVRFAIAVSLASSLIRRLSFKVTPTPVNRLASTRRRSRDVFVEYYWEIPAPQLQELPVFYTDEQLFETRPGRTLI